MARNQGSVRMGPVSLFTLVIILCLAVLAVLAVTTAQASYVLAERQASAMTAAYDDERAGQKLLATLDGALAPVRERGASAGAVRAAAEAALPQMVQAAEQAAPGVTVEANMATAAEAVSAAGVKGAVEAGSFACGLQVSFMTESGRGIDAVIGLRANGTYQVLSWKMIAILNDEGPGDVLWSGEPASR